MALSGCAGDGSDGGSSDGGSSDDGSSDAGSDNGDGPMGGTLNFAQAGAPIEFDPIDETDAASTAVSAQVFSHLFRYDEGTNVIAEPPHTLAKNDPEFENDGERMVVELVDYAEFHNGDPVTAEDVQYTFRQPLEEETNLAGQFEIFTNVEVIDDYTVQFDLDIPYEGVVHSMVQRIVPKSVRENDKESFGLDRIVGSGPFQISDWTEGEYVRFERWDDFWGDFTPNVEGMEWVPIEENTTRFAELSTGGVDIMEEVPPQLFEQFESTSGTEVRDAEWLNYFYAAFNFEAGETTKPKVREAIDYCFTVDTVIEQQVEPIGSVMYGPLPKPLADSWEMPWDEWKDHWHDRNVERAQQLFEEAGVPDNWTCNLVAPPGATREQVGISIANGIEQAGYTANMRAVDWGSFNEITANQDPDEVNITVVGLTPDPDPYSFLDFVFHSEGALNDSGYSNERVDELIDESQRTVGFEDRQPLFEEAIDIILKERAHIPLYNLKRTYGVTDSVGGFSVHPLQNPDFYTNRNNVYLEE
jgi:peptide/nickel transport system substrate-binding protein